MIDKYSEAGLYFNQFSISQFGLHHALLDDFATSKGNNNFLIFHYFHRKLLIRNASLYMNWSAWYPVDRERSRYRGRTGNLKAYPWGCAKYLERGFKGWKQS
jgi:hypothetical protein